MTWNVRGSARPPVSALAEAIRLFEPDVVALQEIRQRQAARLARQLGHHHRWVRKHFPCGVFLWWRAEGLAVLSPHRLSGRRRYVLSPGVHSWTYRRRVALRVRVHLAHLVLEVFDAHLASHDDSQERADQAGILAGHIAEDRRRTELDGGTFRAVVMGDLNAHDEPTTLAPLAAAGFTDAWTSAADPGDDGHTSSTAQPAQRIDYVLVDAAAHCERVLVPRDGAPWTILSDHFPVVADVWLGPGLP